MKAMVHIIQSAEKSDSSICFYPILGILIMQQIISLSLSFNCATIFNITGIIQIKFLFVIF